jgi:hypothetical protein
MPNAYKTMTQIKKVNQTLSFFSMTVAWLVMNFLFIIYQFFLNGRATDILAMLFWTGIFIFIAWLLFIILPLNLLNHSRPIFKPIIFPFIAGLYGAITFIIIVGGIFWDKNLVISFVSLAFVAGLIFGLSYSLLIRADRLIKLLIDKPYLKIIFFLFPFIIFGVFLLNSSGQ